MVEQEAEEEPEEEPEEQEVERRRTTRMGRERSWYLHLDIVPDFYFFIVIVIYFIHLFLNHSHFVKLNFKHFFIVMHHIMHLNMEEEEENHQMIFLCH